jgi:Dockerin type I domain
VSDKVILINPFVSTVVRVTGLSVDTDSMFDLHQNVVIVDYPSSFSSPLQMVRNWIISGYAGGAWNGFGINSSQVASSGFGIGYADASAIFSSFPASFADTTVDATSVLVRYTLVGDANLDHAVTTADFTALAAHFNQSSLLNWNDGDFNYDGIINALDFNALATQFGNSIFPSPPMVLADTVTAKAGPMPSPAPSLFGDREIAQQDPAPLAELL